MCMRFDCYLNILGVSRDNREVCTKFLNRHVVWSPCHHSISTASTKWPQLSNPSSRKSEEDEWCISLSIICWGSSPTMRDKHIDLSFDRRRLLLTLHLIIIRGDSPNDVEIVNWVRDGSLDMGFRREQTVLDLCEPLLSLREDECMLLDSSAKKCLQVEMVLFWCRLT